MFLISHRGNLNGAEFDQENKPDFIRSALNYGFDVEVDVWFLDDNFYLGHDSPDYPIDHNFLMNKKLWCHAKNLDALFELNKLKCTYFWHQKDDYTLTSNNYIWTYPGKPLTKNSIAMIFGKKKININRCAGLCSDYIADYR